MTQQSCRNPLRQQSNIYPLRVGQSLKQALLMVVWFRAEQAGGRTCESTGDSSPSLWLRVSAGISEVELSSRQEDEEADLVDGGKSPFSDEEPGAIS